MKEGLKIISIIEVKNAVEEAKRKSLEKFGEELNEINKTYNRKFWNKIKSMRRKTDRVEFGITDKKSISRRNRR